MQESNQSIILSFNLKNYQPSRAARSALLVSSKNSSEAAVKSRRKNG